MKGSGYCGQAIPKARIFVRRRDQEAETIWLRHRVVCTNETIGIRFTPQPVPQDNVECTAPAFVVVQPNDCNGRVEFRLQLLIGVRPGVIVNHRHPQ